MEGLKSICAKKIFKKFPDIRKILWGGEFWSDGGYIGTVGEATTEEVVRSYIEKQGCEHQKRLYHQLKFLNI